MCLIIFSCYEFMLHFSSYNLINLRGKTWVVPKAPNISLSSTYMHIWCFLKWIKLNQFIVGDKVRKAAGAFAAVFDKPILDWNKVQSFEYFIPYLTTRRVRSYTHTYGLFLMVFKKRNRKIQLLMKIWWWKL